MISGGRTKIRTNGELPPETYESSFWKNGMSPISQLDPDLKKKNTKNCPMANNQMILIQQHLQCDFSTVFWPPPPIFFCAGVHRD